MWKYNFAIALYRTGFIGKDLSNKQPLANNSDEIKDKEDKLTPEMIARNREWLKCIIESINIQVTKGR